MCSAIDVTESPRKGDKLQVKVVRMTPIGAVVRWDTSREGVIRNQELEWGRTMDRRAPSVCQSGTCFPLVVLEVELGARRVELSRKRALSDPWRKVREGQYREGQVVRGEVVSAVQFGAYVEIEPGMKD